MPTDAATSPNSRPYAWFTALLVLYGCVALPAIVWFQPPFAHQAATVGLGLALSALSAIDIETYRLPDFLTLPLIATGLALSVALKWDEPGLRVAAAALGYGSLWAISTLYLRLRGRDGLGLGDAKLFAASGAWLGLEGLPSVLLLASVIALSGAIAAAVLGLSVSAKTRIPFGPFLACGTWLVWLYGPAAFSL